MELSLEEHSNKKNSPPLFFSQTVFLRDQQTNPQSTISKIPKYHCKKLFASIDNDIQPIFQGVIMSWPKGSWAQWNNVHIPKLYI